MKIDRTKRQLFDPYQRDASRRAPAPRQQNTLENDNQGGIKTFVSSLWSKLRGEQVDTRVRRQSVAIEEGDTTLEEQRQKFETQMRLDNEVPEEEVVVEEEEVDVVGEEVSMG